MLKNIDVGVLGYFEKGTTVMRFGFLNSLTELVITPILHRTMNRFMGVSACDEYWCFKVIRDKAMLLKKNGVLQTYNLYTGKLENSKQIDTIDWSKFELFSKTKENRIILISKD